MADVLSSTFRDVRKHIKDNNLGQAKTLLQPLINEYSDDYRIYSLLGLVYHKEGKFQRAIVNYNRAVELNSLDAESMINLSLVYNDLGKYQDGASYYEKAVKIIETERKSEATVKNSEVNNMFAKQHIKLGELYLRYNRAEEALSEFEKSYKLDLNNPTPLMYQAECMERLGKRKQAIKQLSVLLNKYPDFYEAKLKMGHYLYLEGEIGPAIEEWEYVLSKNPDNMEAKMYIKMAKDNSILP